MIIKTLPETADNGLIDIIRAMAVYLGIDAKIETRIVLTTDSEQLADLVDGLAGRAADLPEQKSSIERPEIQPTQPAVTGKHCKYCETPVTGARKICTSPACKRKQQAEYNRANAAKKAAGEALGTPPLSTEYPED